MPRVSVWGRQRARGERAGKSLSISPDPSASNLLKVSLIAASSAGPESEPNHFAIALPHASTVSLARVRTLCMLTSLVRNPACIFRTNASALSAWSHCARISAAPAFVLRTGDRARGELKGEPAFVLRTGDRARGELKRERRGKGLTAGDRTARGDRRRGDERTGEDRPQISRAREGPCNLRCKILAVVGVPCRPAAVR